MFDGRFNGRTAIVTGGASGAGKSASARLVREGATVCLWDVNADALADAQRETGAAHIHCVDVSDADAVADAARAGMDALGHVDLLLCSAGITGAPVPMTDYPVATWRNVVSRPAPSLTCPADGPPINL